MSESQEQLGGTPLGELGAAAAAEGEFTPAPPSVAAANLTTGNESVQEQQAGAVGGSRLPPSDPETLQTQYNRRNPAVKRLLREAAEMARNEDSHTVTAQPLEDNLFEWHFTFRGPPDTPFATGNYHGRVIMPSSYPLSPPEIAVMTPSGRFDTNTKICLSISSYHPESWQPSWSIRTAITALRAFMATDSPGAIGSVICSDAVRRQLAAASMTFECPACGPTAKLLTPTRRENRELPIETEVIASNASQISIASSTEEAISTPGATSQETFDTVEIPQDTEEQKPPSDCDTPSASSSFANAASNDDTEIARLSSSLERNRNIPQAMRMFRIPPGLAVNETTEEPLLVLGPDGLEVRGGDTSRELMNRRSENFQDAEGGMDAFLPNFNMLDDDDEDEEDSSESEEDEDDEDHNTWYHYTNAMIVGVSAMIAGLIARRLFGCYC